MKTKQKQLAIITERKEEMNTSKKKAFTIVELLTVMAIIAILIGLLVPALSLVMRYAKDTKQKAQFHSISAALELFKGDQGDYPDSEQIFNASGTITGTQRLTEALIGRDMQGYDPVSKWHPTLDSAASDTAYSTDTSGPKDQSIERRKGPYLKLEGVGAFDANSLYTNVAGSAIYLPQPQTNMNGNAPMITDVYTDRVVTITLGATTKTVRAGTPILYFKANSANKDLQDANGADRGGFTANVGYTKTVYNVYDNREILNLSRMMRQTDVHPFANGAGAYKAFYDAITNPQIPNVDHVPYNVDSFILMSAGKDGKFGTADDVYNFGQ